MAHLDFLRQKGDAARTRDMLQSWTRMDIGAHTGPDIDSLKNAIYMTTDEHTQFRRFGFYLDKQAVGRFS